MATRPTGIDHEVRALLRAFEASQRVGAGLPLAMAAYPLWAGALHYGPGLAWLSAAGIALWPWAAGFALWGVTWHRRRTRGVDAALVRFEKLFPEGSDRRRHALRSLRAIGGGDDDVCAIAVRFLALPGFEAEAVVPAAPPDRERDADAVSKGRA